jgi:hypothetical protein
MFKSYVIALLIERADAIVVVVDNDRIEPPYTKRWWLLGRRLPFEGYPVRLVDASDVIAQCKQAHLELDDLEQYILKVRQEGIVPVIIGVAVQMLEAWLLAQPEVAENVLWEAITPARRALCMSPEQISHPKNEIIHPHNGGSDLTQTQARQIGGHPGFAPEPIEAACPSFARFAADIRILSTLP